MNIKAKAVAAFQARNELIFAKYGAHVWQHHGLLINHFGIELLPLKWYHTDESGVDVYGPYDTRLEACEALRRYCVWLDQLEPPIPEPNEAFVEHIANTLYGPVRVGEGP